MELIEYSLKFQVLRNKQKNKNIMFPGNPVVQSRLKIINKYMFTEYALNYLLLKLVD